MIDAAAIRKDFPILEREVNGKPLVYLDSAATTQKPSQVIDAISEYYRTINANVHRGAYSLADEATTAYESCPRQGRSIHQRGNAERGRLHQGDHGALNLAAYGWGLDRLGTGSRILLTKMEHHSNVVPWQLVAKRTGAELVYLDIDADFGVDLGTLDELVDDRLAIVAVSGMSNVTGPSARFGSWSTPHTPWARSP